MDVGPRRSVRLGGESGILDVGRDVHLPRVDFENRHPGFDARHRDLDDPVETARPQEGFVQDVRSVRPEDRKSTRLNSSHGYISYAVFCLKKKNINLLILTSSSC